MLPTQTSAYDRFSSLYTNKSFRNRKNKTMSEAIGDVNRDFGILIYLVAASLGVVQFSRWLDRRVK